jgi:hypothetical protein
MENSKPTYSDRIDYLRNQVRKNIANGNLQEVMLINLHKIEETIYMKDSLIRLMRSSNEDKARITANDIIEIIEELIKESKDNISFTSAYMLIDEIKDQYGIERRKEDE